MDIAHIALVGFFGRCHEDDQDLAHDALMGAIADTKGILVANGSAGMGQTAWLLHFGAYGQTKVLAWGDDLSDALEDAANVLPKRCFCDAAVNEAYAEAMDSAKAVQAFLGAFGLGEPELDIDSVTEWAQDRATEDCTYTEAGYLRSWEWDYSIEGVELADLVAMGGRS